MKLFFQFFFLLVLILWNSIPSYSQKKELIVDYQRPFMGVNISVGAGQHRSPNPSISQGIYRGNNEVIVESSIIPEFYFGKQSHSMYFYIQTPLSANFFPRYTGYQNFSFGALVGFGGYFKEATKDNDNLSITMNGAIGTSISIGYAMKHQVYLSTYVSLNFRHHIDLFYGIQYGVFAKYQTSFKEQLISGGIFIGFAFKDMYS